MSIKVKGIKIKDFAGNTIIVSGLLTEDGKKCVACGVHVRSQDKITTFSGENGDTAIVANADVQLFGVNSISEQDENGYVTADLWPITEKSTSVAYMKFHKKDDRDEHGKDVWGDIFAGSMFDGDVYKGKSEKPTISVRGLFSKDILDTIDEAVIVLFNEPVVTEKNAKFAAISKQLTDLIPKPKAKEEKKEDNKGAMAGGESAQAVLEQQ